MADVHDRVTRSYNMSQVRAVNTKPEILVREYLHSCNFIFLMYDSMLPGKPDFVLPSYRVAIFVNGCFWHGHANCNYSKLPKTKTEWWKNKIDATIARDVRNTAKLIDMGWSVFIIWSCELKSSNYIITLNKLVSFISEKGGKINE